MTKNKRGLDYIDKTRAPRVDWIKVLCYGGIIVSIIGSIWALS